MSEPLKDSIPASVVITSAALKSIIGCKDDVATRLSAIMNAVFPLYGINATKQRVQMTIAQLAHESIHFEKKSENLNYSAKAICNTWPKRFPKLSDALLYERNPQRLANKVYMGRMGNDVENDGWLLRGAGYLQLTGKDVMRAYGKYKGIKDPYKVAELLRTDDTYALDSACWFLTKYKNCLPAMDSGDFVALTKLINGGVLGLEDRKKLYDRAKRFIL